MIDLGFVRAGHAIFTVQNATGTHYTYRVRAKDFGDGTGTKHFVELLTGPDNTSSYTYLGMLTSPALDTMTGKPPHVILTKKSRMPATALPVRVFDWALRTLAQQQAVPDGYAIRHAGRCGRCGRMLTVPESLDRGIGPECAAMMGV